MRNRRVLIWSKSISDLLDGNAYGIGVQLYFWAKTFIGHDWRVTTFTNHRSFCYESIFFKHISRWSNLEIIHEWLSILWILTVLRPKLVISRGAGRVVFPLAVISKLFRIKFVLFSASDTDFEIGRELVAGSPINRLLFQKAVKRVNYVVTQNKAQHDALLQNYCKESIILPNIWIANFSTKKEKRYDAIWVANLRPLKRAEWFVRLAKGLPQYRFVIVGGVNSKTYCNQIEEEAKGISNLSFLGAKAFEEVNALIAESRLLVCSSEFEGFPNTFLQAWSYEVPVVSTVNPSEVITEYGLGDVARSEPDLQTSVQKLLASDTLYDQCKKHIKDYFIAHHDSERAYSNIINMINDSK